MVRTLGSVVCGTAALLVWVAGVAAAVGPAGPAAPPVADQSGSTRLLDVPYLPQTEDLCGGAAVAMVLRYWGEYQVYPEDFATLVDRSAAGIRTDVLAADLSRRGWRAFPRDASAGASHEWIRDQVDLGRPIVALIEVRPNRYHYVVVVAWTGEQVVVHDPARAPFHVMSQVEFERAWAPTRHWALLLLPSESQPSVEDQSTESSPLDTSSPTDTCGTLTQEMVELARAGDVDGAETGLLLATRLCPGNAGAWRELAGVRFLQSRWAESSMLAEQSVFLAPDDEPGWDLLATSRFLNDEPDAALEAWNRIGRPAVDFVRVEGVRRTRHSVVAALVDLPPRTILTAAGRGRAARRLQDLPSASVTSLRYRPISGGLTEIDAVVVERSTVPRGLVPATAAVARAWLQHEARLDAAAPTGSGELWTFAWRWWEARPRVGFGLAVPTVLGLPGTTTVTWFWERPSYATPIAEPARNQGILRVERRRAAFSLADWATRSIHWEAGAALDRWAEDSHVSVGAALDLRLAGDRLSIGVDTAVWTPIRPGERFATTSVSSAWRSTRDGSRPSWSLLTGFEATSGAAPFDLWPGAGTGQARTPLLRAHPLLDNGVLGGPVFGQRLAHGTVEYQRPLLAAQTGAARLAAFTDTARAWRRMGNDRPAWHIDVGAGLRVALPGNGGTARIDVARGIRDRRVVLSAGWQSPWPGR